MLDLWKKKYLLWPDRARKTPRDFFFFQFFNTIGYWYTEATIGIVLNMKKALQIKCQYPGY